MKTAGVSAARQVTWPAGAPSGADPVSASLRPSSLSLAWHPKTGTAHRWVCRLWGWEIHDEQKGWIIQSLEELWNLRPFGNSRGLLVCWGFGNFLAPCKVRPALRPLLPGPHCARLSVALWSLTLLAWVPQRPHRAVLAQVVHSAWNSPPSLPSACWGPSLPSLWLLWNAIFPVKPSLMALFTFAYCSLLALPSDLFWVMFLHHTNHHDHNIAALIGHLRFPWHAATNTYLA